MRLRQLTMTAFGPFATTQRVDFDALSGAGLFLLHGATGAGKTSVLDAVCYALYGTAPGARQSRGRPGLRSDHAKPATPTEVVLRFGVAGRRLEITRRPEQPRPKRRGSGTTQEKAVTLLREYDPRLKEWRSRSRSHQEVGEEVKQLLGMSREQFCQVVLLPQGDFARFLRAGAEERAQLLGSLFDTRRFAALERRLQQLRGDALTGVQAADERLLGLAHRMRQALEERQRRGSEATPPVLGGQTAGELDTFPDLAAGEPGLAEEVLVWAALAREHAAQRLAAARSALTLAGAAHSATSRVYEERAELAALQREMADLSHRARELERAAPERERTSGRLRAARAAEQVAPALNALERAEREHRRALLDEASARRSLPISLTESPVSQLTEREQRLRQRLGELRAGRRAERRVAEIDAELERLGVEVRYGEEALADAESWIARWPARRACQRGQLDEAYEAATRAEQLQVRCEQARHRHTVALLRDDLAQELVEVRERALTARETAATTRESWLDHRDRRLRGIAAELAAELTAGEPCAVCGSEEHPEPARSTAEHVSRKLEEEALLRYQDAEERRELVQAELSDLERRERDARDQAGESGAAELGSLVTRLTKELADTRRVAGGASVIREELERAEREHQERVTVQREASGRLAALDSARETLRKERSGLGEEIDRLRGDADSLTSAGERLEELTGALRSACHAAGHSARTADSVKEADAQLADAVWRVGFETSQAAIEAQLEEYEQRALQGRLDNWQAEERALSDAFGDPRLSAAASAPPVELARHRHEREEAERRLRAAETSFAFANSTCQALDQLSEEARADALRMAPQRRRAGLLSSLAGLAAGTSAENVRRMRLESYVLAARLEQVAAAASDRLRHMSAGRYVLVHSDERAGRGARSGLGLHVVDSWTGQERDTATLSGGETFFASLALALGLADVVAQEAGGTRLDTLFIDEGFGTLDEQTLDEVLEVLDSLRERDRSVGIVSHVPDLRLRIPTQLEVVKGRTGSRLRHHGVETVPLAARPGP